MRRNGLCVWMLLVLWLMAPARVAGAQDPGGGVVEPPGGVQAEGDPVAIRFNFQGATFEQVIDFFARSTGLPVVWESAPPEGTLSYLSPESYELQEALRILNIILQAKGVMLRASDDMLYLQKLSEMQREDVPTYVGQIPAEVTSDQIITVVRPLNIALAKTMAERLSSMVASYGSITAMEQQNALVITETAAQVRRLVMIIDELDREDPEGVVEIIALRHAKAAALMEPLKALLAHKVEKYVIDQKGKQVKIEEESMPGLNITADERTNSIIAKGVQSRIDKLKEAIALLDVPAVGEGRSIRTFALSRLAPRQAVATINPLFAKLPEDQRPTLVPLDDVGKLTIIGTESAIAEAASLLREIDGPAGSDRADREQLISVVTVQQADPGALIGAVRGLLTTRQQSMVKLLAGPDGRSLIVSGPSGDVAAVKAIVPVLDLPRRVDKQVRLVRITSVDPVETVRRARALYDRQIEASGLVDDPKSALELELDGSSRTLLLIGSSTALDRYTSAMRTIESATVVDRETRQIEIRNAAPSRLVGPVASLARQLLQPRDGTVFTAPTIEAVDELDLLIVTAEPAQFGVIQSLIETLDEPDPADFQFRVITLGGVEHVQALLQRTADAFSRMAAGYEPDEMPMPQARLDELTGNLIVTGKTDAVRLYERALAEARRLLPPARSGRMIALRQAKASDVIGPLRELLSKTAPTDDARAVPDPDLEVIELTNSLYVVAESAQHQMIERYVRELDLYEQTDLPPLRLIQVRAADVNQIASMLRKRYDARPAEQRREMPVTIDADIATNTLIVTAHEDVYAEIKEFVDGVNRADEEESDRQTMIFALKRARATDLATALEKLYPEPPMPMDRRGRPLPHLREPREVYVSADAATNTLIVEAPAERRASFESLVEQLDRVELPPSAELRTYHIERGDPNQIARTLMELARKGVMSEQPADGSKPVDVLIQGESKSRTLIVAGDAVTFAKTEEILSDLQAVPVQRSLRVFEITGADPAEISERAQRLYAEQTADVPDAQAVSVEVDRAGGTLLVVAENEAMLRFTGILNQLQQTIGPPPDVRLIPLNFADAEEVVDFLRDLAESHLTMVGGRAGPTPTFEPIERTNSILVAAQREQHDIIGALISGLDKLEPREMPPLRILQLRTADAANLASALMRQYIQRPVEERNEKPVTISADAQTNALMVAAHPDLLPEIQSIVTELNTANRMDTEGREIRIFPLKVARAEELARTIDDMFPEPPMPMDRRGRPMPHLRTPREVVVRADVQTNSIIVDAPIQRMSGFEQLVEQLDRQKIADETEIRTYQVVHARLDALTNTLRQLAQAGTLNPTGQDRRIPINISSEPVSQTLIVSGPVEIFERVEQVLSELDVKRAGPATQLRFFKLEYARAESLVPMLREILLTRITEDVPEAGINVEALLNVTADRKTNTLIISAPESIFPVAEQLIEQLDDGTAKLSDPTIRVRPLTFADAREVSTSLGSALPRMISKTTGEPIDVRLIPAPGSSAIILVGLESDLGEVERLIEPLDARPATDAVDAKTFKLTYAEAATVAPIVETVLTDQMASDPRILWERIRRSRGQIDLTPRIRVEAEPRTNSLIVSGPQRTVALAEALITELDQPDETADKTYATYTPENADATMLAESAQRVMEATRPAGKRTALDLIAERESGTIMVIGPPDEVERAVELLKRRDAETLTAPQMDLRIVSLRHSEASVVARAVAPLLADRARWPQRLQAAARSGIRIGQPTVTADAANNRVLISAPSELMPTAAQLVSELDRAPRGAESIDVRIFALSQADADDVAEALRGAMQARAAREPGAPTPTIAPERSSNSIIVTATAGQIREIDDIVQQLDEGFAADQSQVRTVFLKHARAETVAPIVEQLLAEEQLSPWQRMYAQQRRWTMPETGPDVRVAADTRLNAVVISAPPAVLNIAEQMVSQLDVDPQADPSRMRSVRVLAVRNADAGELATSIEAMFRDPDEGEIPPTVRVDRASNTLLVRATDGQYEVIEGLVREIDEATIASSRQMRMIPIDSSKASAAEVARTLKRLLDRSGGSRVEVMTLEELLERNRDAKPRRKRNTPRGASSALPTPVSGPLAAALFGYVEENGAVPQGAGTGLPPWLRSLLGAPGQPRQSVAQPSRPVAQPSRLCESPSQPVAQPSRLCESSNPEICPPFAPTQDPRTGETAVPPIEGRDLRTGGTPVPPDGGTPVPVIEERDLRTGETPVPPDGGTPVAPIEGRDLRTGGTPVLPDGGTAVSPDGGTAVAPALNEEAQPRIPFLARDEWTFSPSSPLFQRPEDEPIDAAQGLREELEADSDVTIAVDPATNSLIVIGAARSIDRVAALAQQIQSQMPAEPGRVRYIALPRDADAASAARLVIQALRQMTPVGGRRGDVLRRATVLADATANALVVTANDTDFETIGELIAALARPPAAEQVVVKIYPLQTITADRAGLSVEQLISAETGQRRRGRQAQRMRSLAIKLLGDARPIEAVFNPQRVRVSPDVQTNSLIVMAPAEAVAFIDQFIELIDQTPVNVQATMKVYPLRYAKARDLRQSLRAIFRARYRSLRRQPGMQVIEPEFVADERTNTLLVTASPEQLAEVDAMLERLDLELGEDIHPLRVIELAAALPSRAAQLLDQVVIGSDQERRSTSLIVADDNSGVLLVRANDVVNAEIDSVLKEIDRDATQQFEVRTITLERADAAAVADAVQRFFDDRARIASTGRGRRQQARRISIVGDPMSKTLLIAASDADYEQIRQLVEQFDSPQATDTLAFRVFQLKHAKASEIERTVSELVDELFWMQQGPFWWYGPRQSGRTQRDRGSLVVRADTRLNALIAAGSGEQFALLEDIIEILDAPPAEGDERIVRLYHLAHAELNTVAEIIREMFTDTARSRRWWMPADPHEVKVRSDERTNTLIVSGTGKEHDEIGALVTTIDEQMARPDQQVAVLTIEFAQAPDVANMLTRFLRDRARADGKSRPDATISASRSANSILVAASPDELNTIRDLIAQVDQPDISGDRVIEIIVLDDGDAQEVARIVKEQFGRRGAQGVVVTADARTNSLIINAPKRQFAQARALVEQLDAPSAADETIIRTYALTGAEAEEAVRILTKTLQLDDRGETTGITIKLEEEAAAVEVKAQIVADRRSNSLVVTATSESFPVIESLIRQLDEVPAVSPMEYRIITLDHALAEDVAYTLGRIGAWRDRDQPRPSFDYNRRENQLVVAATADQFDQITEVIAQIDQPSQRQRITDFVPLQYAEAEKIQEALSVFYGPLAWEADTPGKRNVRIVADPATNSLVISADETEWADIRALLGELDSEEYDASLQLAVIPLLYADARSVARAINDAFQGRIERDRRAARTRERDRGRDDERREMEVPTVLVEAEEWVRASAEVQTNSVVVSASRQNIGKIEQIVGQLDVADYAKLPAPRLIPVATGDAEQLADALREIYERDTDTRGRKGLRIVGEAASNTVIVRAEEEEFQQIRALADALQQETATGGLAVHVIKLSAAPARRVADALTRVYEAKAEQTNQPLAIQVDPVGNSLVIASTMSLYREIEQTVEELDALAPAAGHGIFIIELEHIPPEVAKDAIEQIGLDKEQRDDSVSRLVTEPVKVGVLAGRNAIVVVANPVDRDTIVGLVKAIDAEPRLAEAQMRLVKLRNAEAEAVAEILGQVLSPGDQQVETPLAEAVQEQVRRLSIRRDGLDEDDVRLDLTVPIRLVADAHLNAIAVSSTEGNVSAVVELITMLDALPITGAVAVQILPLENIAADQFARIVRDLFDQGKDLGRLPVSEVEGMPGGAVGRALLEEVALSVDERTNTVVVAGNEEAVALVEVLRTRLDADVAVGWVEPRVIPLEYADATDLSETLQAILVEGARDLPQASPLQRQIGRLRMARLDERGGQVLEADVFQAMTRLVIRPEPQLNALILVGTPMNIEVVGELVSMLDVEAASPDATVRIYPVEHASAARLAAIIESLFDQQVRTKAIRPEDRAIVEADERTNALIVTTSPRSFAVLEGLLRMLDAEIAPDLREIRRIELENSSASRLARLIQQLMDARLERLRKIQPETADLERATIVADPRTNSLVIAAGNESFEVIKRVAAELDSSTMTETAYVHVIPLEKGNVDRLAEAINAVMERRYADLPGELRASQKPLVLTDPRSNSLLVAANPEDLAAIEDIVSRLEAVPSDPAVGVHVVNLPETASAELLAPRLQRLMRDRQQSLGEARRPSDRVTVEPDPVGNTLIVAASDENIEVVRSLVEVLVEAGADAIAGRMFEVISLRSSRAVEVVDLLQDLYVNEANRTRGRGAVQVTADERINAVLVKAAPSDVSTIRDLVGQLDGARPDSVVEIKYIPLQSANALETVSLIENVLSGRGIGARGGTRQATVLKYLREIARGQVDERTGETPTEMEVSAAVRESIILTPDLRTNTIIVSAPRQSMEMIEQMIRDLDMSTTGSRNIRIFKLANADATAMAEILADLFNLRRGRNLYVLKPREAPAGGVAVEGVEGVGAAPLGGLGGTELTAVPDERQELAITVDSRTNSLLVSGTPTYLDLVSEVVEELDALEANEREVLVYQLRNAKAAEVARVISEFVREEQQKLIGTLSPDQLGSASRLLEREITITGDVKSNTVLVSASPRYMERVKNMITQLDVDPPQVLIEVMLAEVTLDTDDEWGVDFGFTRSHGATTYSGGFGLASAFVAGMGVPNLAIASTDFDLLINAMRAQGRLQVLSNPSIMTANNEQARIQIGETVLLPTSTSISDAGQVSTQVAPDELGVILEVTPSINPDGFVRMDISPQISNLSERTTRISEDFESPVITRRVADTTVTVYDGQTVVIGGLISDRVEKREQMVPILGEIPLIGELFKHRSEATARTELIIVLTPYVVESPAEIERVNDLTRVWIERLTVPEEVKESIRSRAADGKGGLFDAQGNPIELGEEREASPAGERGDESR